MSERAHEVSPATIEGTAPGSSADVSAHEPPDFIGEAIHEVRAFLRTSWSFLRRPSAAARAWSLGESDAMNPLSFLGAGIALHLGVSAAFTHFFPAKPTVFSEDFGPDSALFWAVDFASSQLQLLLAAAFAWLLHRGMRQRGSTLGFRATLGVVFLAEGIVESGRAIGACMELAISAFAHRRRDLFDAPIAVFEIWMLTAALSGAHRLRLRDALWPVVKALLQTVALVGLAMTPVTVVAVMKHEAAKKASAAQPAPAAVKPPATLAPAKPAGPRP